MTVYISKKRNIKFNIPVYSGIAVTFIKRVTITLSVLAMILAVVCAVGFFSVKRVTVEAGEQLTAAEIVGDVSAYFGGDFDPLCLKRAGVHYFTVIKGDKEITVRLKVNDTKAPKIKVKDVCSAVGGTIPLPEEYIDTVDEAGEFTGEYVTRFPEFKAMGTYSAQIRFTDAAGNKTEIYDVKMTIISDSKPPEIEVLKEVTVLLGEVADFDGCVKVTDNCTGKLTMNFDCSEVNYTKAGKYSAYAKATDAVGNVSERVKVTVRVVESLEADQ